MNLIDWHNGFQGLTYILWRTRDWTEYELDKFEDWLFQPFLEQYSVGAEVRFLISEENTSDLFRILEMSEKLRPIIVDAFRRLRLNKKDP